MVRFKHRYLLCEVRLPPLRPLRQLLHHRSVRSALRLAIAEMHGDYGLAACEAGLAVKYVNAHTGSVLIRVRQRSLQLLTSALAVITSLQQQQQRSPCAFHLLHVGGTIRTCQKFLLKHHQQHQEQLLKACNTEEEREALRGAMAMSCPLLDSADDHGEFFGVDVESA
ncbi:ribonuclease P/MRP protein subunit POP5 [Petromyzon marinus]|uniref:ribonuclease P/MRP protein subunit POP5 n=1 Tax=Petromyzon marinus TaxID=7757 RepID=UPI003F70DAC3